MGLSYDIRKATARKRREMKRRNREQDAKNEEAKKRAGMAGREGRKMQVGRAPENKMLDGPPENKALEPEPQVIPMDQVPFASPQAEGIAEEAGLTGDDFRGRQYSGASGFTAADVRGLLEERK